MSERIKLNCIRLNRPKVYIRRLNPSPSSEANMKRRIVINLYDLRRETASQVLLHASIQSEVTTIYKMNKKSRI